MNVRTFAWIVAASCGLAGCIGSPSSLAPGIRGSIGVPHRGCLTDGASLPNKGAGFERFRKHEVRWGNPRLVSAITVAAAEVSKARGGAPLLVGDLSFESGGVAEGHRSHRNGRDADLILYALTPNGRSVRAPGFIDYGPDGLAVHEGKFFRLDIERTWLLVKALLTAPGADVQWLFLAAWLEALVIEHARARGESLWLIHRAESVLLQPGDSSPHADHLHVRLACTPDELVAGCYGGGPRWRWLAPMPQLGPLSDEELIVSIIDDLLPNKGIAVTPPAAVASLTASPAPSVVSTSAPLVASVPVVTPAPVVASAVVAASVSSAPAPAPVASAVPTVASSAVAAPAPPAPVIDPRDVESPE